LEAVEMKQSLHFEVHRKKVFVFDWDGTILDSMPLKTKNFAQAFKTVFPENTKLGLADIVAEHYLRLSGHPRKYIFNEILNLLNLDSDEILYFRFNAAFEALNKLNLIYAKVFPDAMDLLKTLIEEEHQIYISSSVPPKELTDLVDKILPVSIRHYISSVLGSSEGFEKGTGHLYWIIDKTGATPEQILVVGDDIADFELSLEAGIDCVLVDRKHALKDGNINIVSDLYQLRDGIKK
jgi:phosphoglycolate phosphatase-like HAD superfamily hydrolase